MHPPVPVHRVDGRLLLAVRSLYYCSEVRVRVGRELKHDCSPRVLDSDKGVCCHHIFSQSNPTELDRLPSRRGCHSW